MQAQESEELSKTWCSGCHLYPDPQLLDKKTWTNNVLPEMGARLGFKTFRNGTYRPNSNTPDGVYATEPLMEMDEWEQIKSWYESQAPEQLALPAWQSRTKLKLFKTELPKRDALDFPASTAIFIDEAKQKILVADSFELDIDIYAQDLSLIGEVRPGGVVSRISRLPSGSYLATIMGETIGQSEGSNGSLVAVATDKGVMSGAVNHLARNLQRPVNMAFGDFNNDAKTDYVIAEFGMHSGKLSLYLSQTDGTLLQNTLLDEAGATAISVVKNDLLVLIAQGNERIIRLKNFTSAQPTEETIMRFPPSQGSSSMSALDFNKDGIADLLYTAGDNADISAIFKPYHGIYLFAGQPDATFRLEMFFHLDGATSAVAEDFDQDGDIDIAAIAYYANSDQNLDQAGFVYLQNDIGSFKAKYVEGIGKLGRLIAIATGDLDGDGDLDIALANLAFGPPGPMKISPKLQERWTDGTPYILLRNGLY